MPVWLAGVLAVMLLVIAGVIYRLGAAKMENPPAITLPVPLRELPTAIAGWQGRDLEIPTVTQEYMKTNFADDYVSRRYSRIGEGVWADAYVVYCSSRPGGVLGHQPMKCFPAHGWIHDDTARSEFVSRSGRQIKCLVHWFHKPAPAYQRIVVLGFYVLNGQITLSERDFSGMFGRMINISGNPARYVAQVQVSSVLEHSARSLACELADSVLAILPDQHGQVRWPILPSHPSATSGAAGPNR
ncbi:MAG: exosortase-associated EpsI family protein [Phycisphaerales bacterium]|nr:MAG: exosortase-associated EpsI family protein [Phycisphaerales bacterium]